MWCSHRLPDLGQLATAHLLRSGLLLLCCCVHALWGQEGVVVNVQTINTPQSEFSPAFYGEELVYVHQPPNGRLDPTSKKPFYELFIAPSAEDRRKKSKRFNIELNSAYHEGPISFSKDRRQVFFTKTNARGGVTQTDERGNANLKIYYAYQGQYDWTGVREVPVNDVKYNTLHPSLSPDGNRLFFASDREGGFGGLDLYVSEWVNGQWSPPINLGPEINTSSNECYPFIHDSGQLFFASAGRGGLGNLDLFTIDLSSRNWGKVYSLPPPYNSEGDDFGFILAENGRSGYLSSNRAGGMGSDDIYQFSAPRGLSSFTGNPVRKEIVKVYDGSTSGRLPNARVLLTELRNAEGETPSVELLENPDGTYFLKRANGATAVELEKQLMTDRQGEVEVALREGRSYRLLVHLEGYLPQVLRFQNRSSGPSRPLEVVLQRGNCAAVIGQVTSAADLGPVNGAEVNFFPVGGGSQLPKITVRTDAGGNYYACVPATEDYQVTANGSGYLEARSAFNASGQTRSLQRLDLILARKDIAVNRSIATLKSNAVIVMERLEYEDDRYQLSSEQNEEVLLLYQLLAKEAGITIRLEDHTETGGPEPYHQDMSKQRVDALKTYLVSRGIHPARIQTLAHGSQVPRNTCALTNSCNEQQHRDNRRTEVRILTR